MKLHKYKYYMIIDMDTYIYWDMLMHYVCKLTFLILVYHSYQLNLHTL